MRHQGSETGGEVPAVGAAGGVDRCAVVGARGAQHGLDAAAEVMTTVAERIRAGMIPPRSIAPRRELPGDFAATGKE
ncbi:MAG: hypothetical protein WBE65_10225 [Steroidobacteraceae bacterium]